MKMTTNATNSSELFASVLAQPAAIPRMCELATLPTVYAAYVVYHLVEIRSENRLPVKGGEFIHMSTEI